MNVKIILLFVIFFSPFILSAQQLSTVTVYSEDGEKFILYMDGEQKNREPSAEVRVRDLTKPSYDGRVVFTNKRYPEMVGQIKTTTPKGKRAEVTYKILKDNKGEPWMRLLAVVPIKDNSMTVSNESAYSGTEEADNAHFIDYTRPVAKVTKTDVSMDDAGNTTTVTKVATDYGQRDNTKRYVAADDAGTTTTVTKVATDYDKRDNARKYVATDDAGTTTTVTKVETDYQPRDVRRTPQVEEIGKTTTTVTKVETEYEPKDNVKRNPAGCIPMSGSDFDRAKRSISSVDMEEQKLITARDIGNNNCFTSEQVTQIMNLFSLERTKLNFAKFAYAQTVDPGNYFKVNSSFESEESKKSLFDYVSAR